MLLSIAWAMETIGRNIMQIFQDFDSLSVNLQISLDDLNNDDISNPKDKDQIDGKRRFHSGAHFDSQKLTLLEHITNLAFYSDRF